MDNVNEIGTLLMYTEQLIEKGKIEIEVLSNFDQKLSDEQCESIQQFKRKELDSINSVRTALVVKYSKDTSIDYQKHKDRIEVLIKSYYELVSDFSRNFPV